MNDIRFALRQLRKSPGFTLVAVVTLALGIGLNTAIFSLINELFLRGLPFKDPSRVVHLYGGDKSRDLADIGVSAPRFMHYREGQTLFDGLAGESFFAFTLTGLGDPVQVFGGRLTSNYFDVLGVRPIRGRNFLPGEEEGADVALVTENFCRQRLRDDAADTPRGRDAQFPRGFRDSFRRGKFRVADRMQQCRQFIARSFQRPSARDRVANGDRRLARKHRAIVRFRKFTCQFNCGSSRGVRGVAVSAVGSTDGVQFPSAGSEHRDELVDSGAHLHDRIIDPDRTVDGSLSGTPGFSRRFGGRIERGRPRRERQCAAATFSQNPGRRASGALGYVVGRRGAAYYQFHPFESAEHRLPFPKSLDGRDYIAGVAISRCRVASAFCRTNAQ